MSVGDTLSIKVYQALTAALKMRALPCDPLGQQQFPLIYMAQGLIETLGQATGCRPCPPMLLNAWTDEVAVVLAEVDYRTGRRLDAARSPAARWVR